MYTIYFHSTYLLLAVLFTQSPPPLPPKNNNIYIYSVYTNLENIFIIDKKNKKTNKFCT